MTARDEAARAIWDAITNLSTGEVAQLVDAIPADVLARLAIERGALELVKGHVRTYRVVES